MTNFRLGAIALTTSGALCLLATVATAAGTPAQKCEAGKNDAAGKYAACSAKAEKGLVATGDMTKYGLALTKCEEKFTGSWSKLESAAEGDCPSDGDVLPVQGFVDACVQSVAEAVSTGGSLPLDVATCNTNLGTCGTNLGSCTTNLGTCNGNLGTCTTDLGTCNGDLGTCTTDLGTCDSDLDACEADVAALEAEMRCPASGIGGLFTTSLPTVPNTCATEISFSGATVVAAVTDCSSPAPDGNLTGTVTGNVVNLAEEPSAACTSGLRAEVSVTFDNDCDTATGTYICRAGPGGMIYSNLPVVVTRN